jgi:hypothetical protein
VFPTFRKALGLIDRKDGTVRVSRNVCDELSMYATEDYEKSEDHDTVSRLRETESSLRIMFVIEVCCVFR